MKREGEVLWNVWEGVKNGLKVIRECFGWELGFCFAMTSL